MSVPATRVSVPGKLILMGEHAAVYGRPAVVTAIGLRMRVQITPREEPEVALDLADLGAHATLAWSDIAAQTRRARERWEEFAAEPTPGAFARLRPEAPTSLVALALGEAADFVASESGARGETPPGLDIRIRSQLPIGSGFGSSAAAAVGLVAGYLSTSCVEYGWSEIERITLEIERRQHGFPSGIDSATVYHGGVLECVRDGSALRVAPLAASPDLLRGIRVFDTGAPAESTGTVVADVRARRDRDPAAFDKHLDAMEAATVRFRASLVADDGLAEMIEPVRSYQRRLEAIGVVPSRVRAIVAEVEAAGGAAKISGAGALSGRGAGCLLVVHPSAESVPGLRDLEHLQAPLGAEGVRLESLV